MEEKRYFAAANTVCGFVNYYHEIFGDCEKIYIIKGGSGTGKSRFMRDVAEYVLSNLPKARIEYFYCSFDPNSLDGIMIDRRIAVIDGTPPHIYEPTLPGAKEELVDLGVFWSSKTLAEKKNELLSLMRRKKAHFERAYRYLSSYGELMAASEELFLPLVDHNRLCADAAKRVTEIEHNEAGGRIIRPTSAFGRYGVYSLNDEGDFRGRLGIEYLWLLCIIDEAERFGMSVEIDYDPLFRHRPSRVTVGGTTVFSLDDIEIPGYLKGCADIGSTSSDVVMKTADTILNFAALELSAASSVHFDIEKIYASAMDFEKKEAFTKDFLNRIEI